MAPVIFAGTSDFSAECLDCLLKMDSVQIKGVLAAPDRPKGRGMRLEPSPVKALAAAARLPVWTPESPADKDFLKALAGQKCRLSVICAYGKWLPRAFLDCFPMESLNVHPSLLPRWRGAAPIERALMAGDRETGVSLQKVAAEMDAGDIVARESFPIEENDTAAEVSKKAVQASKKLLREALPRYLKGEIQAAPQPSEGITCAPKIQKQEARLVWNQSAAALSSKVRALSLGPQAFMFFRGKRIKIHRARDVSGEAAGRESSGSAGGPRPGEALPAAGGRLIIACGSGALEILELQKEGKKKQPAAEFLKGCPLQAGDVLE